MHSNFSQNPFRPAQQLVTHADHKDLELEDGMLGHLGQICRSNLDGTAPSILQLKPQQTKQALAVQPAEARGERQPAHIYMEVMSFRAWSSSSLIALYFSFWA